MEIVKTRDELLPSLVNSHSLKLGVEVGVRDCYFSELWLNNTHKDFHLLGIDIQATPRSIQFSLDNKNRFLLMLEESVEVAKKIKSDCLIDIVHIDAGHTYEDVKSDIEAWWPKVRPGGFLTGDDYCICNTPNEGDYGIVEAVEEWAEKNNMPIYLTQIGYTCKDERLSLAKAIGYMVEDNLKKMYEPHRPHHENAFVPTWVVRKPE